jgi:amidase
MTHKNLFAATLLALISVPASSCGERFNAGSVNLSTASLADLTAALDAKRTTSAALVKAYLARIAACNPELHAIIATNPNALRAAEALDRERAAGKTRGPLHGIPVVITDNIDFAGMVTTAGSLALKENLREHSAPLVERLEASGLVVVAKANLSEWANFRSDFSSSGWSAIGGLAVNPVNKLRTACGSSSGSAAAVAAHLAPLAVGTETNGSIVCPSSITGLVGLKPTVGVVAGGGIVPISHTQDTAGPMAARVADAALLLGALAQKPSDYRGALQPDALKGTRIGVARFIQGFSPQTLAIFGAALERLKAAGAELVDVNQFDESALDGLEMPILLTEFKADLDAYLSTAPAAVKTRTLKDLIAFNTAEPRELEFFGQDVFEQAELAKGLDDPDYKTKLAKALSLTREQGIDKLLADNRVVALVAPTAGPAWMIDLVNGDRGTGSSSNIPAIAGYPHLTVPMGKVAGLPVGLSFIGKANDEQTLLSLGYAYERVRGD